ncbi:hypothetical protein X556_0754 [Chlamydia pneumoniae B21]|nr:hypothetical protein X556_0754 [Chlamydia pneumoniae B21]
MALQIHNQSTLLSSDNPLQRSPASSFCQSKIRILAITLLVLGVLLLISGALFLALGIPGLTLGSSFGVSLGLSALGGVLVVSGLLFLLVRREVPTVPPEQLSPKEVQKILNQLPGELDQLDAYIQQVISCSEKLEDIQYHKSQSFLDEAKEKLRIFDCVHQDMMAEFLDLQKFVDQERLHLERLIFRLESIGVSLFSNDLRISLSYLAEWCGYLPSGDARAADLKREARRVTDRFMRAARDMQKILIDYDKNAYGMMRKAFDKAFGVLENYVYQSHAKSYKDRFLDNKKAEILQQGDLEWLRDRKKKALANLRFTCLADSWKDLEREIFWVKEDGSPNIEAVTQTEEWQNCFRYDMVFMKKLQKIMKTASWDETNYRKETEQAYAIAKAAFEKDSSNENQKAFKNAKTDRLRCLKRLHDQEFQRAQERLRELQTLYPEVSIFVVETKREETLGSNSERSYENLEEQYQSCVQEQNLYWEEIEKKETEFRETGQKTLSTEDLNNRIHQLEKRLRHWSKDLTEIEKFILGAELESTEEKVFVNVAKRLEVVCGDIEEMLPRLEEIEQTLHMVELPLLPMKQAFEKACAQYNLCKEGLAKVEPFCKKSSAYRNSEERLKSLHQGLQSAYRDYQKRTPSFSDLESQVSSCRDHIIEKVTEFETQGRNLIKEELFSVSDQINRKIRWETRAEELPFMKFYWEYRDRDRKRVQSEWEMKTERYRNAKKAFQEMVQKGFKEENPLKEEEYRSLLEERKSREKRLICNKIEAAQQRVQEFGPSDS